MDTDPLFRRNSRIKISRNAEGKLVATGTPATESFNDGRNIDGQLIASSPETKASIKFSSRNGHHRDDQGNLLDKSRRIDRGGLIDTNRLVDLSRATQALDYAPTDPRFTRTEHLNFALAYQDTTSRFGEIASHLPGRTSAECTQGEALKVESIDHYYQHKFDGRFKDESREKRYRRLPAPSINGVIVLPPQKELVMSNVAEWDIRLREVKAQHRAETVAGDERFHNSGRRMRERAEVPSYSNEVADDDLQRLVPLHIHITELRDALEIPHGMKLFQKTRPAAGRTQIILPRPFQLEALSENFQHPFDMTEHELMHWLRSERVLPLVKECIAAVHNEDLRSNLLALLREDSASSSDIAGDLTYLAQIYKLWPPPELKINHEKILIKLAQFAYRIGRANHEFLSELHRPEIYPEQNVYFDGAFVLLFAIRDFFENENDGFFATLLSSELAGMVKSTVRGDWERLYSIPGEEADEEDDPIEDESGPRLREMSEWETIFEYEGREGRHKDWKAEVVVGPAKLVRTDSGLGLE